MPVVSKKKIGISYLYQAPFIQQLGVYARPGIVVPYGEVLAMLASMFSYWDASWNVATAGHIVSDKIIKSRASNFVINLSDGYESIAKHYHKDLIKNLKRSDKINLYYHASADYNLCIDLFIKYYADRTPHVSANDYENFRQLSHFASQNNMLLCRCAVIDSGEIAAAALMLADGRRIYNMMNTTTSGGRNISANHFLIDAIMHEFAGQEIVFDFEGSDLPGVKSFYENFGAVNEPFYHIKYNNLPWPARLIKK